MMWSKWMRLIHRWVSIFFALAVILNGVLVARGQYATWSGLLALIPLALLLLTGLYLFALPYTGRWRAARQRV